jgi:hypothetical protein
LPSSNLQLAEAGGLGRWVLSCCAQDTVAGTITRTSKAMDVRTASAPQGFRL